MTSTETLAGTETVASKPGNPIRVGLLGTITALDPRKAADYVSGFVLDQIFETPYASLAGDPTATPLLFEPLRSEDGKKGIQYSAGIRPGIVFSDGTPLTAGVAALSLQRATVLAGKATVDARGDRVWFTLSSPRSRFDLTLTQSGCAITLEKGAQILGTGPYMFEGPASLRLLQASRHLRLVRNPRYHGTPAGSDLEFEALPPDADGTPRALVEALRGGAIEITTALSAADLVTWQITGVTPVIKPANSTGMLFMNTSHRLLSNPAARKAVASAMDLLEIASRCYDRNPAAFVATAVLPPAMSRSGGTLRASSGQGASQIDASGLRGATLSLLIPWSPRPYLPRPSAVAEIIQRRLAAVGVTVTLIPTRSPEEFFRYLVDGKFDLALAGWIAETVDPADFYEALLSSQRIGHETFVNCSRWNDPATDALLERFRVDPTEAHRMEIERVVSESMPFLPLVYGQSTAVHSRRLRKVTLTATGSIPLADARLT